MFTIKNQFQTTFGGTDIRGDCVEKPAETQTSILLDSYLVRVSNSRSGGCEFESPIRRELGTFTRSGKIHGVRSFYSGDPVMIT
jgi:hypothetical protein